MTKKTTKKMTRGYRNCNPGNIRVSGDKFQGEIIPSQDGLFKQFSNMAYGYRAMFRILKTYIKKYNLNTVGEIIRRWAPGNENDTDSYIKAVSARTGISPGETIRFQDKETMLRLVAAMSYVENGMEPDVSDIHSGWNLL